MSFGRVLILTNLLVLETGNDVRETTLLILEADLRNPPQLKITGLCFNQDLLVSMYLSKVLKLKCILYGLQIKLDLRSTMSSPMTGILSLVWFDSEQDLDL